MGLSYAPNLRKPNVRSRKPTRPCLASASKKKAICVEMKSLMMITLQELEKNSAKPGEKAWVCNKGIIYDVSSNEVYTSEGGYNCF